MIEKRTRPVPPHGLEDAIRAGRRRRMTAVATGTTGTVAAAAAAVFLLSGSSSVPAGLTVADDPTPDPTAAVTAIASAAPVALPTSRPTLLPAPTATEQPCEDDGCADPEDGPDVQTAPSPAGAGRERPDYREDPEVVDAPLECRQAPSAAAGPVVTGGAAACAVGDSDDTQLRQGETWRASMGACQAYGAGSTELGFAGGAEQDLVVRDARGVEVFRFSASVRYTQGAHSRVIADGTCAVYALAWDTRTTDGDLVPPGSYDFVYTLTPSTVDGEDVGPDGVGRMSGSLHVAR